MAEKNTIPASATAALLLADGKVFFGHGLGANGLALGEICFNTAMTGYQEVMTDPSYAGQIITFTFPHIGNVGANDEDIEAKKPAARGLILREPISPPSNFRSSQSFEDWLIQHSIPGICGIDTRALTRHIRLNGAQNGAIVRVQNSGMENPLESANAQLKTLPRMEGLDLAKGVTASASYEWNEGLWSLSPGSQILNPENFHVIAIDYGEKLNILRSLVSAGCKVTVVPATASAEEILSRNPDGIFLSNGPGDPAATGQYAIPVLQKLMNAGIPILGICLGHQLLALALGAATEKMHQGHRGANHPVKNLTTGHVEITSQNHGFMVMHHSLPEEVEITHTSLFDGTIEGLRHKTKPIFSVQYHPESSPGPHDSRYLFDQFVQMMAKKEDKASGIRRQGTAP